MVSRLFFSFLCILPPSMLRIDVVAVFGSFATVVSICRKLNQGIGKKDGASDRNGHRHQVFGHAARCEPVPCLVDQPADGGHEGFVRFEHFVPYHIEWIG